MNKIKNKNTNMKKKILAVIKFIFVLVGQNK